MGKTLEMVKEVILFPVYFMKEIVFEIDDYKISLWSVFLFTLIGGFVIFCIEEFTDK